MTPEGPRAVQPRELQVDQVQAGTTARALALPLRAGSWQATSNWGMLVFILTEATLFAAMISAYFYLRFNNSQWPLGGIDAPELLLPAIMTVILIASSIFMAIAESGVRGGSQGRLRFGMAVAWILSAAFLVLQAYEYSHETFGPATNAYGSAFFTITGLHGSHVFVALLIGAFVQVRAWLGHFDAKHFVAVQNTALYWHFVDVVWLFVFTCLYLYPHLLK